MNRFASRRSFLASSLWGALGLSAGPSLAAAPAPSPATPWRNWSGELECMPAGRVSPLSESALADLMSATSGPLRPVGSGHSFSPLVPTDGHLVVIDRLSGMLDHDADALQATFGAGTRLSDIGPALASVGQAMPVLPDIDRQTLAGATATGTHGTGIDFMCLSGYVTALRLVTAAGATLEIDERQRDLFDAARVNVGALGVVTAMTLQNQAPFRLKARNTAERIEDVLDRFDTAAAAHRHFEMFPLVHSDYALVLAIDETDESINNPPPDPEEAAALGQAMAYWASLPPGERQPLIDAAAAQIEPTEAVDVSHVILANERYSRFNEMEYSVPLHNGADCLREVLRTIKDMAIDVVFPLEYRYVRRDDTMIGMSSGDEDHAAISIHRVAGADHRPYFDAMEPIFWKYGGRPHWGKIHSLGATGLAKLYPRYDEFRALREALDPQGRFLNDHLRRLFFD